MKINFKFKIDKVNLELDYETYTCKDVDLCNNIDCDDCLFGRDDIFTLEQIKERLIEEDW